MKRNIFLITLVAVVAVGCAKKQKPVMLGETFAEQAQTDTTTTQKAAAHEGGEEVDRTPIYFDYDSAELSTHARSHLNKLAKSMTKDGELKLTIEGNTDSRGSTEYNLALGERRARAAKDYLARLGVDSNRVDFVSFGEERPALGGDGEEAWSQNRRDEFVLTN